MTDNALSEMTNAINREKALALPPWTNENPSHLKELFAARGLLFAWVRREFRVRYNQSVLGATWAILQPLALMVIFSLVFGRIVQVNTGNIPYPLFSYVGSLAWTFFANSLSFAIPSLVANLSLVSKIYFPREILPLASVIVALIDFVIAALLLIPLMLFYGVRPTPTALWLPLILLVQMVLTFGISLFASAMNVSFRDIRFVVPLTLQIWMYLSPVIYPVEMVPDWIRPIYFLNPMAVLIDSYRRVLLNNQAPVWLYLGLATMISLLILVFGYRFFKRAERHFADVI